MQVFAELLCRVPQRASMALVARCGAASSGAAAGALRGSFGRS